MYRVYWKNTKTGYSGNGNLMSFDEAESWVTQLNTESIQNEWNIFHWLQFE
jgi:hypothetical protein